MKPTSMHEISPFLLTRKRLRPFPLMSRISASIMVADSNLKMDLYEALKILKPDERTCITLQLMDGLPIDKIVEITGITQNTVKSHLSRGKQKLASYLKANGYDGK